MAWERHFLVVAQIDRRLTNRKYFSYDRQIYNVTYISYYITILTCFIVGCARHGRVFLVVAQIDRIPLTLITLRTLKETYRNRTLPRRAAFRRSHCFCSSSSWHGGGMLVIARIDRIRLTVITLRTLKATYRNRSLPRRASLR